MVGRGPKANLTWLWASKCLWSCPHPHHVHRNKNGVSAVKTETLKRQWTKKICYIKYSSVVTLCELAFLPLQSSKQILINQSIKSDVIAIDSCNDAIPSWLQSHFCVVNSLTFIKQKNQNVENVDVRKDNYGKYKGYILHKNRNTERKVWYHYLYVMIN